MKSFFSKKIVVGAWVAATVCVSGITDAKAQEFTVQGDIVSSYVWRGTVSYTHLTLPTN